jgi:flagellar hook assembly protein FlgD
VRSIVRLAIAGLVGVAGVVTPLIGPLPATVAATSPKVVIIVGPVGSATASYRAEGDAAAAAAAKYTSNVVKLYTPNATWAVVKPALQGASVVIYFGHGNGFPSPYLPTLTRDRQDGLGLNPVAGADDSATKYWGEQYLASDVQLAPNAVVLLGHLCYASGSSEPGLAAPTLDVAKQRVDNFAAGFIAAGASAVFADAHGKAVAQYVDALFSTHQSLGQLWAAAPSNQGNAFSFPSTRTPGATVEMDPDKSSGEYHRSIVGNLDLQTDAVFGGAGTVGGTSTTAGGTPSGGTSASSGTSPGGSGNGGMVTIGGAVSPAPALSPAPTPGKGSTAAQGPAVVSTDTVAPTLLMNEASATATIPDSSGDVDRWAGTFSVSEAATIDAVVSTPGGAQVRHFSVQSTSGATAITWDWRTDDGGAAPDGQYVMTVAARDVAGNPSPAMNLPVSVFRTLSKVLVSKALFYSQDGDAYAPSTRLSFQLAVPAWVTWTVADATGHVVFTRYQDTAMAARSVAWIWTGLDQSGEVVAPGRYSATVSATTGTLRASATIPLTVAAFAVTTSPSTAVQGRNLTVTAVSAEPLSGSVRLTVAQPGAAARTVLMTRIAPGTYRATIRLVSGGSAGNVSLQVSGKDAHGGSNVATAGVALK